MRFAIIHSVDPSAVERRAIAHLSELLLPIGGDYPICIKENETIPEGYTKIFLGTRESNSAVRRRSSEPLTHAEEYRIEVKNGEITVEGYDFGGVLYGAIDLYNRYLLPMKYVNAVTESYSRFDEPLSDFSLTSHPSVRERGIWTWGHVIYDYRGFIDNMVKLKMNSIIIWNDHIPFNMSEIIDYAHSSAVSVILGYSWGWDQRCKELSLSSLDNKSGEIFEKFEREYKDLPIDGIYFQTITELEEEYIEGVLVADAVTDFVNKTAALFYEKYPDLLIEFGLHATSVKNRLDFITKVDKRLRIVWEDFGAMPFAYNATDIRNFEETKELCVKCSTLRGECDNFGVVTKSVCCLDWKAFVHPSGPQNIGVSTKALKQSRMKRKERVLRSATAGWILNGDKALETVSALVSAKGGDFSANALVEDGVFGERIPYSVALFAEILWRCCDSYPDIVKTVSLLDYVEF